LILAALLAVYIVLGILYESYIHPITILSTLPSAGVGAVLALLLMHMDLSLIALIGIILLIGIVKKNAIMMIDFALAAERGEGKSSRDAIFQACMLRFRPIMMTTIAALFGALPLALGTGTGSELRRPLGISIIGGLLVSQMLTRSKKARTVLPKSLDKRRPSDASRCKTTKTSRCMVSWGSSLTSVHAPFPSRRAYSPESSTTSARCTPPSSSIRKTTTSPASSTPSRSPLQRNPHRGKSSQQL